PIHLHRMYRSGPLPVAEDEWPKLLTLPLFPTLSSDQVSYICDSLRAGLASLAERRETYVGLGWSGGATRGALAAAGCSMRAKQFFIVSSSVTKACAAAVKSSRASSSST